nr:hypothetical protein [Alphaproteobacteria bacterium]
SYADNRDYQEVRKLQNNILNDYENDFSKHMPLEQVERTRLLWQAVPSQLMTGKRAKVVLILENPAKEMKYFERVQRLAFLYDFDAEYITPEILPTQNGKCIYRDCKCYRKNQNNKSRNDKKVQNNKIRTTN